LLSLLRVFFALGFRFKKWVSWRNGSHSKFQAEVSSFWASRFNDLSTRLDRAPLREIQTFLELCDYHVLVQIEPLIEKKDHWIALIDTMDPRFEEQRADRISTLHPDISVWVMPHYDFVLSRLRINGLLKM